MAAMARALSMLSRPSMIIREIITGSASKIMVEVGRGKLEKNSEKAVSIGIELPRVTNFDKLSAIFVYSLMKTSIC